MKVQNLYNNRLYYIFLFLLFTIIYYYIPFYEIENLTIILSITTFLMAIISGFFISRQAERYSTIRKFTAVFDGAMTSVYRNLSFLGKDVEEEMKKILQKHYKGILRNKWDYYISKKSTTLISIYDLIKKYKKKKLDSVSLLSIEYSFAILNEAQLARKRLVSLHRERIPRFQWFVILLLTIILLFLLSGINSYHLIIESIFKSAFANAVLVILILLHKFDCLDFYDNNIGEKSAQDVLDILNNKK